MSKHYHFSSEEDEYIKNNYLKKSLLDISRELGISKYVVRRRYRNLNLVVPYRLKKTFSLRAKGVKSLFTEEEDAFIRDNYLKMPLKRIAIALKRSSSGVSSRMKALGLEVPADLKQKFKEDSWIKKGNIPPNKGKKMPEHVRQKMQRTFFKKGN